MTFLVKHRSMRRIIGKRVARCTLIETPSLLSGEYSTA